MQARAPTWDEYISFMKSWQRETGKYIARWSTQKSSLILVTDQEEIYTYSIREVRDG